MFELLPHTHAGSVLAVELPDALHHMATIAVPAMSGIVDIGAESPPPPQK